MIHIVKDEDWNILILGVLVFIALMTMDILVATWFFAGT